MEKSPHSVGWEPGLWPGCEIGDRLETNAPAEMHEVYSFPVCLRSRTPPLAAPNPRADVGCLHVFMSPVKCPGLRDLGTSITFAT